MNLTVENFQQKVDQTILDRGWRYAQSGKVMNLVENKPGCWSAKVQGTKIYDVTLQQIPSGELSHLCTCPYDWGPICKHIAAVLFLIEGSLSSDEHVESPEIEAGEIRPQLAQLPKSKLVNLLVELAAWDRQIETLLRSRISAEGQSKHEYTNLVENILDEHEDRYQFIDYRNSMRAAQALRKIIHRAQSEIDANRFEEALTIYQAVIETVAPVISRADDSSGMLSGCIQTSLLGLSEIANLLPPPVRKDFFDYCLQQSAFEKFTDWG